MKNVFLLSMLLLSAVPARVLGQLNFNDSLALSRNRITQDAMLTLGGFAIANIASGFIAASGTRGETRYVWRMNGYWNLINLGVAGLGYMGLRKAMTRKYSLSGNEKAQLAIEKTYVLNFGLDLVYITGGFYLRERGNSETNPDSRDQFKGYGTSIIFQGAFLLLMDGVMIVLHHRNSNRLNGHLQRLELVSGADGLGLGYSL